MTKLIVAGLCAAVFYWLEPDNQRVAVILAAIALGVWSIEEAIRKLAGAAGHDIDEIKARLKALEEHPLNTAYIAKGVEGLVDEHNARNRGPDRDHAP
jgi:hypothetical protein